MSRLFWDKDSREFFNPSTVQVENYAPPAFESFTDRTLVSLTGAPPGSKVMTGDIGGVLDISIVNDTLFDRTRRMSVLRDANKSLVLLTHFVQIKVGFRRRGIFARMLWCMARACSTHGISAIHSQGLAASSESSASKEEWSGAVTAVALGFDGLMLDEWLPTLPEPIRHLRYIREVVDTKIGAKWWEDNPNPLKLTFDPRPGSKSMEILGAYIRRNRIRLSQ